MQVSISKPFVERIVYAANAVTKLPEEVARLGGSNVFIITGGTLSHRTNFVERVRALLGESCAGVFDHVVPRPPRHVFCIR